MKERDFMPYVADMIEAIDKIIKYLDTVDGLSDFLQNDMVIDAVTRNYEIIGEASKMIPQSINQRKISRVTLEINVRTEKLCGS